MKKINLFFLTLFLIINVKSIKADEITDNIVIQAKWYQENYDVVFYPINEELEDYTELKDIITYGESSEYKREYCNLGDGYLITKGGTIFNYKRVGGTKYIKLENISLNDVQEIKIYEDNKIVEYTTKENNNNILITLDKEIDSSLMLLYIDTEKTYNIKTSTDETFTRIINLSKNDIKEKILIPDKNWTTSKTQYFAVYTSENLKINELNELISENQFCSYQEIKTLRYKKEISYYDDELHNYVAGYLPDLNTIDLKFVGKIPEKIITNTETEYVYINQETEPADEETQNQSINESNSQEPIIKYIENSVYKDRYVTPKYNYYIIGFLLFISIIELIIIIKNNVDRNK